MKDHIAYENACARAFWWETGIEWFDASPIDRREVVEEWTAIPIGRFVASADHILERIGEWLYDETHEDAAECIEHAMSDSDVVAAFEAARAVLAGRLVGWSQADKKVSDHLITWDATRQPLLNGEPLYVPAGGAALTTGAPPDPEPCKTCHLNDQEGNRLVRDEDGYFHPCPDCAPPDPKDDQQ